MKSLRARLTFTHAMVAFIAVMIVAVLVTILFRLAFERQRAQVNQQQLQFEADSFAERLGEFYQQRGGWDGVETRLRQQLARAASGAPIRRLHLQIFDAHSHLLFDSAYPGGLRQGAKIPDGIESPIVVDGQTVGSVVLDVPRAASNPADRAFVLGFYLSIVIGSALAGLIALAVGRLISGRMTRPLRSLKDAARRLASGARHELICSRLHDLVALSLGPVSTSRLLERRSVVQLFSGTLVRPDLALVTAATGKIWLAAEVISSDDHRPDTVMKKQIYEELNIPRLWMVDPRYDNVEIYHGSQYGLMLKGILAGKETLTEQLLPALNVSVAELFREREQ